MGQHQLFWDIGSAYDLFVSLRVIHDPEAWGLRGAWAAGVRSRMTPNQRDFLKSVDQMLIVPFSWIAQLPQPKNGRVVLDQLQKVAPADRLTHMFVYAEDAALQPLLEQIDAAAQYSASDVNTFFRHLRDVRKMKGIKKRAVDQYLHWRLNATEFGDRLLDSLTTYYNEFFAEEEQRIQPYLERALQQAQQAAAQQPLGALVERLTSGVRLEASFFKKYAAYTFIPSFWVTPILIIGQIDRDHAAFLFGARSSDASLVPGEVVPDALYQSLKALADPTRLRIMRYLTAQPHTPTELANKLRLRTPTVSHHLHTLRLAQLVVVTPSADGSRQYAARTEALDDTLATLNSFLEAT